MKKIGQYLLLVLFLGILFAVPVLTKIERNDTVTFIENRKLAVKPVLARKPLLNGKYSQQWEGYISDHIYSRSSWIKSYIAFNMNYLGKTRVNAIVIGKEGYLLPFYPYQAKHDYRSVSEKFKKVTERIKTLDSKIKEYGGIFYFVGIPEQSSFHRDKYPDYFNNNGEYLDYTERLMFSNLEAAGIGFINMNSVFRKSKDKDFYFKTDHHYSFEGAYATYCEIMRSIGKNGFSQMIPLQRSEMDFVELQNPFGGTRNRQLYYLYQTGERLQIGYPKHQISYNKVVNGKQAPKLYYINPDKNALLTYSVFMGGDSGETIIRTDRPELPDLLIFGDSFTNAIEPLLYYHFNETRILDLRYYGKMGLYEYIGKHTPDVVIMVRDDTSYGGLTGNGDFGDLTGK